MKDFFVPLIHQQQTNMKTYTNDQLIQMLKDEVSKTGFGVWSNRRKALEEMLRMRGVNYSQYVKSPWSN